MKVTSFETSKKLAELGFKSEPDYMWNESLADTAARLLIQLYNAGLVKFKEE